MRLVLGILIALVAAPVARAGVDLHTVAPLGRATSDTAALAAAGDVNGDGLPDLAVGMEFSPTRSGSPEIAAVAFAPGFSGLTISHADDFVPNPEPAPFGQVAGGDVVGVGDWDGDGLADVAFGAGAGAPGRADAGSVFVVLGRRTGGEVDVRSDPRVVRIRGARAGDEIGNRLGAVGDGDGDGRPDLAISLPGSRAVIVRGGSTGTIDLADPPAGTTIPVTGLDGGPARKLPKDVEPGPAPHAAASFAAAGDIDGDGRGDVLVGVPAGEPLKGHGRVYVLRGGASLDGAHPLARFVGGAGVGQSVATVPDSNGDGHPEWLIGAAVADGVFGVGGELAGGAFVVFSNARGEVRPGAGVLTVNLRGLGANAGRAVAGVSDLTGDGVPDLLVGLPDADPACRNNAGAIALVPGARGPGTVRPTGARIDGARVGGQIGTALASGGGELFVGARPFEQAASLDVWRLPLSAFADASPALPRDCLKVSVAKRSRAALLRDPRLRVSIRSDAGDGRAHRVRVRIYAFQLPRTFVQSAYTTVRLREAGHVHVTVRLPRRVLAALRRKGKEVTLGVEAEQRLGPDGRTTSGASGGAGFRLR